LARCLGILAVIDDNRQQGADVSLENVPEPARAALRFIAMYGKIHPEVRLEDAAAFSRLVRGAGAPMWEYRDDGKGVFEVYSGERTKLDLSHLYDQAEP
jgi:hypothetical protein